MEEHRLGGLSPQIVFTLENGEFGQYLFGFRQEKVIEIFEQADTKMNGELSTKKVEELDLGNSFYSDDEQIHQSRIFLSQYQRLDLPSFIKYASLLIHPLLKRKYFQKALKDKYGIGIHINQHDEAF